MQFNPGLNKQANEVYFSWRSNKLNNSPVQLCESQKHQGITLDKHLNFLEHIERKIEICNKLIGTIKHLYVHLLRKSLLTIYKSNHSRRKTFQGRPLMVLFWSRRPGP